MVEGIRIQQYDGIDDDNLLMNKILKFTIFQLF